jgi:hypothetical protein
MGPARVNVRPEKRMKKIWIEGDKNVPQVAHNWLFCTYISSCFLGQELALLTS